MLLKTLLKDINYLANDAFCESESITGLCSHSKKVQQGEVFVDWRGVKEHAEEALKSGAKLVVSKAFRDSKKPLVCLKDFDEDIIKLIQRFYDKPHEKLRMIGLTGTCGKTTTSYLIYHVLKTLDIQTGLIGTIETIVGDQREGSALSTTDVVSCYALLNKMVKKDASTCVMEVTSHGIDQKRVEGINFGVAIFTNLSHEHLDYHKTFEHYKSAKKKLFTGLKASAIAIVNSDDQNCSFMVDSTKAKIVTFGIETKACYRAVNIDTSSNGTVFDLVFESKVYKVDTLFSGQFNVYNTLACIAALHQQNLPLEKIIAALKSFSGAAGRLQKIKTSKSYNVYVDFAHKPDALENVLKTLRALTSGKIITVVGCGGDRDKEKRPKMASIAEKYSESVVLTSDNPRSEDPLEIIKEMQMGISKQKPYCISDRKKAIEKAIDLASGSDIILIAGKGHESYQLIKGQKFPFDDAEVVREVLSRS